MLVSHEPEVSVVGLNVLDDLNSYASYNRSTVILDSSATRENYVIVI